MNVKIAKFRDLPVLMSIGYKCMEEAGELSDYCQDNTIKMFLRYIDDDDSWVFIANDSAVAIVSLDYLYRKRPIINISMFYVIPEARGKFSREFGQYVVDFALSKKPAKIYVDTVFDQHSKLFSNFFKKFGFKSIGDSLCYE